MDPSGNIVKIAGYDVSTLNQLYTLDYSVWSEIIGCDTNARTLYSLWNSFSSKIDPIMANELEQSTTPLNLNIGNPSYNSWVGQYDRDNNTLTLENDTDFYSHSAMLTFAHECRHAYQETLYNDAVTGSWDKKKWDDVNYREWDAYKYEGDLDDRLGWHQYWLPMDSHCFAQKLNLETSYSQYLAWKTRLFSLNGSPVLRSQLAYFNQNGLFLTAIDYANR